MGTIRSRLIYSSTSHSCMFGHPIKHRLLKLRKLQKTIKLLRRSAPVTHIHTVGIDIARTETLVIVIRSQMHIGHSECAECAEQHIKRRYWLLAAGRCGNDTLRRLGQRSQRHVKVLMHCCLPTDIQVPHSLPGNLFQYHHCHLPTIIQVPHHLPHHIHTPTSLMFCL